MKQGNLNVRITYCAECGFHEDAARLAAAIAKKFGVKPVLKEGKPGIFEVKVNGKVVCTNRQNLGIVPKEEEVLARLAKEVGDA